MGGKDYAMQINKKTHAIQMRLPNHISILGALVVFELLNSVPDYAPPLKVLCLNGLALPCFYGNCLTFCPSNKNLKFLRMHSELGYVQILLQTFLVLLWTFF